MRHVICVADVDVTVHVTPAMVTLSDDDNDLGLEFIFKNLKLKLNLLNYIITEIRCLLS